MWESGSVQAGVAKLKSLASLEFKPQNIPQRVTISATLLRHSLVLYSEFDAAVS